MKLFYSPGACSLAAHFALEEAKATYEVERFAIIDGGHLTPKYLAINPQGRVPALLVEGVVITELPAILLFIAESFPAANLMPANLIKRAQLQCLMAFISSNVHIQLACIWRPERFTDDAASHARMAEHGKLRLGEFLESIEQQLPESGWVGGEHISIADLNLLPFYRFGWRVGLDMRRHLKFTALVDAALRRPAVQKVLAREGLETLKQPI